MRRSSRTVLAVQRLTSVDHSIVLVHHLLQQRLVVGVHRRDGDVPHCTKLSAVVQVLVLQTKKVPHEPPETAVALVSARANSLMKLNECRDHSSQNCTENSAATRGTQLSRKRILTTQNPQPDLRCHQNLLTSFLGHDQPLNKILSKNKFRMCEVIQNTNRQAQKHNIVVKGNKVPEQ